MKTGILGGTFNPVHNSHIYLARELRDRLELDRVLFVPTCLPPHKGWDALAEPEHRLAMCLLALADQPGLSVCAHEIERGGKSYTADTLAALSEQYPEDDFYLLLGADMFLTVQEWRRPGDLFRGCVLCVAARDSGEKEALEQHEKLLAAMGARSVIVDIEPKPLSSTQVRQKIREGQDASDLLPPAVWDYIKRHALYGYGEAVK